jgi:lysophospholipase L1-like esterase
MIKSWRACARLDKASIASAWILTGALVLGGLAETAHADAPTTIAILGSSTAAGTGATNYDSAFAGKYGKYLGGLKPAWKLQNYGVGGYTTYNVMPTGYKPPSGRPAPDTARNITKVLSLKPYALLICLPSNDINNGYPASEYNANFDSLHAWASRAGIKVWVTTPLPRTALDSAHRVMLIALRDRILNRFAPRAINFYQGLGDEKGNYFSQYNSGDGIHTNDKGHQILFERTVAADIPELATPIFASSGAARVSPALPTLVLDRTGGLRVQGFRPGRTLDVTGRAFILPNR